MKIDPPSPPPLPLGQKKKQIKNNKKVVKNNINKHKQIKTIKTYKTTMKNYKKIITITNKIHEHKTRTTQDN